MKQTVGMIFACVLVASMAFGMGKVGAAPSIDYSDPNVPWEPAKPDRPIEGKIEVKQTRTELTVKFLDLQGNQVAIKEFKSPQITLGYTQVGPAIFYYLIQGYGIVITYCKYDKKHLRRIL